MIASLTISLMLVGGSAGASGELEQAIELLERLDTISLSVRYEGQVLKLVVDDLNQRIGVPIRADWEALRRLGIRPHNQVWFRLEQASASTVLAGLTLTQGDEFGRPVFESHAGQLVLTTVEATAAMRLVDVYDVRDLIADEPLVQQLRERSPIGPPATTEEASPSEDAAPEDPGGDDPRLEIPPVEELLSQTEALPPPTPGEELLLLISDHVDPEAWINFGGSRALITERDGVVFVTAPPTTHRKFREALRYLRMANPASVTIEATIVDVPRDDFDHMVRRYDRGPSALVQAIQAASTGTVLWQARSIVAMDELLQVESGDGDVQVALDLRPGFDRDKGSLIMRIVVSTYHGSDHRRVQTTVAFPPGSVAAVIELPAPRASDEVRVLLLALPGR